MAHTNEGLFDTVYGMEVLWNRIKMGFYHLERMLGAVAAGTGLLAPLFAFAFSGSNWGLFWRYNIARVFGAVHLTALPMWGRLEFTLEQLTPAQYCRQAAVFYADAHPYTWLLALVTSAIVMIAGIPPVLRAAKKRGIDLRTESHRRGARLISTAELTADILAAGPVEEGLSVCGIPLPKDAMQQGVALFGAPGTGKTVVALEFADQLIRRGTCNIFYDESLNYTQLYYRPETGTIFDPWDRRFPGWSVFNEIKRGEMVEFETLAEQIIAIIQGAKKDNSDTYFKPAVQTTLQWSMISLWRTEKPEDRTNEALLKFLFFNPDLAESLRGTPAFRFVDPEASGSGKGGIDGTALIELKGLMHIKSGPFSIRDWVRNAPAGHNLFIAAPEEFSKPMRPIIAMIFNIAFSEMMSVPARQGGEALRYGIFGDEFATLGPVPAALELLAKGRKYGVGALLIFQSPSQIEQSYGKAGATTLLSCLQTTLTLGNPDPEAAESLSKRIGSAEIDDKSISESGGPADAKDSHSTTAARKDVRVVIPTQIQYLAKLEGYFRVAGSFMPAKVKFKYVPGRKVIAEALIRAPLPKVTDDEFSAWLTSNDGEVVKSKPRAAGGGKAVAMEEADSAATAAPAALDATDSTATASASVKSLARPNGHGLWD